MTDSILLTGFGPFGSHRRNTSEEAVRALEGTERQGFQIRTLTLPVQYERAVALLQEAIEAEKPAAVIGCGIHEPKTEEGPAFRVELAARNVRNYEIPDVDGEVVRDGCVEEDCPAQVFASLPVGAIKLALEEEGLEASLSEDAGQYLCNAIFYWTARRLNPTGFLHFPAEPEQLDAAIRALEIAVDQTARRLLARRVEATA